MVDGIRSLLGGTKRIAMQYSPKCAIPYVAMVDAGTIELVRGIGVGDRDFRESGATLRGAVDRRSSWKCIWRPAGGSIACGAKRSNALEKRFAHPTRCN